LTNDDKDLSELSIEELEAAGAGLDTNAENGMQSLMIDWRPKIPGNGT
jgi:hypothetical protein